jgi:hypothetical protein
VAKGRGAPTSSPARPPRPPSSAGIRFFIGAIAVALGQVAIGETGMHGLPLLIVSSAFAVLAALLAIFFDRIANWYPKLELRRRLRVLGEPKAYFVLFCVIIAGSWVMEVSAKVTAAIAPSGSYVTPQSRERNFSIIPTHARLRFPEGAGVAEANGKQENIWSWSSLRMEGGAMVPTGRRPMFDQWLISLVFMDQTAVPQLFVHSGGGGRPLPPYDVIHADPRQAQIMFRGDLAGFDIDITNVQ